MKQYREMSRRSIWSFILLVPLIGFLHTYVVEAAPISIDPLLSQWNSETAQEEESVTVRLNIVIDDSGDYYPLITSRLTTKAPASWPEIQAMRAHGIEEERFFESYLDLLDRFAVDGWFISRSFRPIDYIRNTPSMTIQDERATLEFRNSTYIYSIDPRSSLLYLGGVTIRPAINTEGEAPFFAPQDLLLDIHHTRGSDSDVEPISTTHIIELEVRGLQVVSASPFPSRDDGANLVWIFEDGETAKDVQVRLRPKLGTSLLLWTNLGFSFFAPLRFLPGLMLSLSLAAVLIATVGMIIRLPANRLQDSVQKAAGDLRHAAIWALVLSFGLDFFYDFLRNFRLDSSGIIDLTSLGLYLLLLLFWLASQPFSKHRAVLVVLFIALLVAPNIFEFILLNNLVYSEIDLNRPDVIFTLGGIWILLTLLRLGLITYLVVAGIISFIVTLWPADWPRWLREWIEDRPKILPRRSVGLLVLSILIVVFWLAFQIESLGGSVLLNFALQSLGSFSDVGAYAFNEVRDASHDFGVNILGSASALLPFVALSGVIGLLYELSRTSKNIYFLEDEEWALSFVALLFAGFVVGTGGTFIGIRIPIAFLVALVAMRLTLSNRIRKAEQKLREINPLVGNDGAFLLGYRKELLQRARALENLSHQHTALYAEYTSGKLDEKVYETKRAELQEEIDRLAYGDDAVIAEDGVAWKTSAPERKKWSLAWLIRRIFQWSDSSTPRRQPIASLRLTKEISPNRVALTLGSGDTWWENASQAVDIGWKLALFPILFYLYALFSENALVWLSPRTEFGILLLMSGFLREVVFWLTAAFVFGCIYPYLPGANGVLKGAFLAGIWIVSVLFREVIGLGQDTGWIFRSLQLLLFLTLLGAALDLQTLLRNGIYWRHILDYYQLRDVRTVIGYVSPLILALIAIAQQLLSGQALEAITEIIKNLPQTIPLF